MIIPVGSGGLSKCSIIVHVETGSTVGAYSNAAATTLVKLGEEIGTSGDYVITGLNTGTYYVKTTKGSQSAKSSAITFSAYGAKSVNLSYALYIFQNGTLDSAAGGLKSISGSADPDKWEITSGNLHLNCTGLQSGSATIYRGFNNVFDLSAYSYLHIKAKVTLGSGTSAAVGINLNNSTTLGNSTTLSAQSSFHQFDVALNLSTKNNYVVFKAVGGTGWSAADVLISDIWAD